MRTDTGQFYGIIVVGSPREFIVCQFHYDDENVDVSKGMNAIPEVDFETIMNNYHRIISKPEILLNQRVILPYWIYRCNYFLSNHFYFLEAILKEIIMGFKLGKN
jgi:hypothetical protein